MFTHAIVRKPCKNLIKGLTNADLGKPDYELALSQHTAYVEALMQCGLEVEVLEADEQFPDSTFVEDTALLTKHCAIITNPGAPSRQGETKSVYKVVQKYYDAIEVVKEPGTVEGGDIMMAGSHFYIGLSDRTNREGASQVVAFLEKYGFSASIVEVEDMLHLKTGISYLEDNTIVAAAEYLAVEAFQQFKSIEVDPEESYAANCLWVNGHVLVASGFPKTAEKIASAGYSIIEVDVSEYQKLDGGLSCLSLRF